mgnify:CR=1 FL=1
MKILIISDSHGRLKHFKSILESEEVIDLIIHSGDIVSGAEYIKSISPCPVEMVAGNCDYHYCAMPKEKVLQLGKYKTIIIHGHKYGVNNGTSSIKEVAMKKGADIVIFGHTHLPLLTFDDGIWLVNPGSISLPRQEGRKPTYIVMDIDSKGDVNFTLKQVEIWDN